ncbi:MAG: outer membrane beta-barrel protein [Verrucomicrobiota bacterium JB023]|nr:outer membrane beta-barrel protein [Verrucomicrobiota bacterium JB023]
MGWLFSSFSWVWRSVGRTLPAPNQFLILKSPSGRLVAVSLTVLSGGYLAGQAVGSGEEAPLDPTRDESTSPVSWQPRVALLNYEYLNAAESAELVDGQPAFSPRGTILLIEPREVSEVDELFPDGEGVRGPGAILPDKPADDQPDPDGVGSLQGEVFTKDGEGLPGVIVSIPSLNRSARSDQQGLFAFPDLPAGDHVIKYTKLGYFGIDATITVTDEKVSEVSQVMEERPVETDSNEYELEEIEIVGEYVEEDSFGGIEISTGDTPNLFSGIGKAEFEKQSVSNAAEAIGKVSGANIVDGKYAVVRGLADRYVTTTFNNGVITSADPSRKTIQLDLLPTSVIQGIAVSKTYDVSMPGDFGGGAINIQSLSMPEEQYFSAKYKVGWNSNLEGDFYRHPDRDLGFWGSVDEEVSNGVGSLPNPNTTDAATVDAAWDTILENAAFRGRKDKAREAHDWGVSYGDVFDFDNGVRLGIISGFSHKEQDSMTVGISRAPTPAKPRSYTEDTYSSEVDWSVFLAGELQLGDNHGISATYFKKRNTEDSITVGRDVIDGGSLQFGSLGDPNLLEDGLPGGIPGYGAPAAIFGEFWDVETVTRDLELFQLLGDHDFGENAMKVKWGITANSSSEIRPNSTTLNYSILDFTDERLDPSATLQTNADAFNTAFQLGLENPTYDEVKALVLEQGLLPEAVFTAIENGLPNYSPELGEVPTFAHDEYIGSSPPPLKSYIQQQSIREDTREMFTDLVFPFELGGGRKFQVKAGFRGSDKTRESRAKIYEFDVNELNDADLYTPGGIGSEATQDTDLLTDLTTGNNGANGGATLSDITNQQIRNFDGTSNIMALYLGGELSGETFSFNSGIRYELENKSYFADPALNAPDVAFLPDAPDDVVSWLPSVGGQANLFDGKFTIGAYYSRTVARPTFFEFLPAKTVDQATGFIRSGNPALTDTGITNFDLSFEYRFTDKSRLVVAPFYKSLEDPIVAQANLSAGTIVFTNGTSGNLQGIEAEFEFAELDRWTLRGNYTYIESELVSDVNVGVGGVESVSQKYPGQPAHIFNLSLGYELEDWGLVANLIYNYTGDSLLYRRFSEAEPFIVSPGFHQMDFNLAKTFDHDDYEVTVGFTVKNLFNTATAYNFEEGSSIYEGQVFDERRPGRTYQVEAKIKF